MSDSASRFDRTVRISRRSVLQRTGGLLVGATVLAESAAAVHPLGGISVNVKQETINPAKNGLIPVEVTFPSDIFTGAVSFPSDVFLGVGEAFETLEEGELVHITEEFQDGVASPVRVADFGNPHDTLHGKLMHFPSEDLRYPQPDNWDGTLGLGVFPDGVDDFVPGDHWDTDTVKIAPRVTDN